ncbi:MAG: M56 family metallopeptidase, partial [Longimicrobiales bacterium]
MNVLAELFGAGAASAALAWLTTYGVHSTILLGGAALLTARLVRDEGWREAVWKIALVGGVLTASAQAMTDVDPVAGRLSFAAAPALEPGDVVTPTTGARGDLVGTPAEADATPTVRFDGPAGQGEDEAAAALAGPVGRVDAPGAGPVSEASGRPMMPTLSWPAALLFVWALLATLHLGRLALRQSRLWRLLRGRRDVRDGRVRSLLAELRRNAGYWRPVRLTATSACATPLALGSSEICVPERLVSRLTREAQRSALAHELAHLRRRDPHWQLATGVLESVLFFQPLNRLARRRIRESAEHLCDDWAVRQTGSAVGLARCLAEVAGWIAPTDAPIPAGTAAMAEDGSPLLRRVERVLRGDVGSREPRPLPRALAAGAALAIVVA